VDLNHYSLTNNFNFYTALVFDMSMFEFLLTRMVGLFALGIIFGFTWAWFALVEEKDPGLVIFEDEAELQEMCIGGLRRVKE